MDEKLFVNLQGLFTRGNLDQAIRKVLTGTKSARFVVKSKSRSDFFHPIIDLPKQEDRGQLIAPYLPAYHL
jgi:hypothetical protein